MGEPGRAYWRYMLLDRLLALLSQSSVRCANEMIWWAAARYGTSWSTSRVIIFLCLRSGRKTHCAVLCSSLICLLGQQYGLKWRRERRTVIRSLIDLLLLGQAYYFFSASHFQVNKTTSASLWCAYMDTIFNEGCEKMCLKISCIWRRNKRFENPVNDNFAKIFIRRGFESFFSRYLLLHLKQ